MSTTWERAKKQLLAEFSSITKSIRKEIKKSRVANVKVCEHCEWKTPLRDKCLMPCCMKEALKCETDEKY